MRALGWRPQHPKQQSPCHLKFQVLNKVPIFPNGKRQRTVFLFSGGTFDPPPATNVFFLMEKLFNVFGERNHYTAFKADVKKIVQ